MIGNAIAGFLGLVGAPVVATSFESIATTTVGASPVSSISFTSIPATFTHLQIRYSALNSLADNHKMQFNSDTASNYSWHELYGDGTAAAAASGSNQTFIKASYAGTTTASFTNGIIIDILDYANTNKYKTTRSLAGVSINAAGGYSFLRTGNWRNTAAITSIQITPITGNFTQYSSFALYGIKGA